MQIDNDDHCDVDYKKDDWRRGCIPSHVKVVRQENVVGKVKLVTLFSFSFLPQNQSSNLDPAVWSTPIIAMHFLKHTFVKSPFWRIFYNWPCFWQNWNWKKSATSFTGGACCSEFQEVVAPLTNSKQGHPQSFFFLPASLFWKKSSSLGNVGPHLQFLTLQTSHSIYFRWHSFFLSSKVITARFLQRHWHWPQSCHFYTCINQINNL